MNSFDMYEVTKAIRMSTFFIFYKFFNTKTLA